MEQRFDRGFLFEQIDVITDLTKRIADQIDVRFKDIDNRFFGDGEVDDRKRFIGRIGNQTAVVIDNRRVETEFLIHEARTAKRSARRDDDFMAERRNPFDELNHRIFERIEVVEQGAVEIDGKQVFFHFFT